MPDLLLSELCAICHIRPHKYRCPRCSARTCSLPCVKRHKQWSQCNGIRDPSTYIKRTDLATPRGIDHDYNYLTSIERQLDSAERDASERGFIIQDAPNDQRAWRAKGLDGPKKGDEPMRRAAESCGVVIERAPEGMARRKQNATSWHKKKKMIQWTVEWIHPDGRAEFGSCLENAPIAKAYAAQFESPTPKHEHGGPPKKRRKHHGGKRTPPYTMSTDKATSEGPTTQSEDTLLPRLIVAEGLCSFPSQTSSSTEAPVRPQLPDSNTSDSQSVAPPQPGDPPSHLTSPSEPAFHSTSLGESAAGISGSPSPQERPCEEVPSTTTIASPSSAIHFYLHAPRLPSPHPVLIPLSPEATLSESLRSRLVLEFPTIYALSGPQEKLTDGYVTEEAFFMRMQADGYREKIEAKLAGNEEGEMNEEVKQREDNVDEKRLKEVLKRDLRWFQGAAA